MNPKYKASKEALDRLADAIGNQARKKSRRQMGKSLGRRNVKAAEVQELKVLAEEVEKQGLTKGNPAMRSAVFEVKNETNEGVFRYDELDQYRRMFKSALRKTRKAK